MSTKISHKDVVNFFDEINKDMAELVLGIIKDNMARKAERRQKMSVNLKKARAAKGKGGSGNSHQSQSSVKADPAIQAEVAAGIPVHRSPGRPRRVAEDEGQGQAQAVAESA